MARQNEALQAIEDELVETLRLLWRLPDRERGFLMAGRRSSWPEIVRDADDAFWLDFDPATVAREDRPEPRIAMSRKNVERMQAVWLRPGCLVEAIRIEDRKLVATVAARKAGRMPGGFRWEDVWQALRGRLPSIQRKGEVRKVTSDDMRKRYEAALGRMRALRDSGLDSVGPLDSSVSALSTRQAGL